MSEIQLTTAERERLRASLVHPPSTGFSRRALALRAWDEGPSVGDVAELLGVSRPSVSNWAQAFERFPDPQARWDRYGGGRPTLGTPTPQELLQECLGCRPDQR